MHSISKIVDEHWECFEKFAVPIETLIEAVDVHEAQGHAVTQMMNRPVSSSRATRLTEIARLMHMLKAQGVTSLSIHELKNHADKLFSSVKPPLNANLVIGQLLEIIGRPLAEAYAVQHMREHLGASPIQPVPSPEDRTDEERELIGKFERAVREIGYSLPKNTLAPKGQKLVSAMRKRIIGVFFEGAGEDDDQD